MELITAMKIIRTLHLGKSPETEAPLPVDSVCMRADVKEALEIALERLAFSANQNGSQHNLPPNQGKAWSPNEDAQLAQEFDRSLPEGEMAQIHGRSQWAITKRLERLGKIPASEPALPQAA